VSASAGTDDVAWVDVLPSMANFGALLSKGLAGAGKKASDTFGKDFEAGAGNAGKKAAAALTRALDAAKAKVSAASTELTAARNKEADAAAKTEVAELKLQEIREKESATASQVAAAEARLAKAQRDQGVAADSATAADARMSKAQREQVVAQDAQATGTKKSGMALGNLAVAVTAVGAAIAIKGVKNAADFQTQLTRLATSAGESTANLGMVSTGVLNIASTVGTSATDLANGLYTINSAGYHAADGLMILKAAAQGAKEENADLGTVSNALTDVLTDYHYPAIQASVATSELVETAALGKTSFEELAGSMSTIAPLAASTGIGITEMLGDLAQMTSHGVSASESAQQLANAIRSLSNPTSGMTTELAQLGIRSDTLSKNLGKTGVSGAMNQISDAILQHMGPAGTVLLKTFNQSQIAAEDATKMYDALPKSLQKVADQYKSGKISSHDWTVGLKSMSAVNASLVKQWAVQQNSSKGFSSALKSGSTTTQSYTQALAKATGNATSMNVAMLLTGENSKATADKISSLNEATDEAGYNVKGWGDIQGNFNQKVDVAKSSLGALSISIGQQFLPLATKVITAVAKIAQGLAGSVTWLKNSSVWVKAAAVALGTLILAATLWTVGVKAAALATKLFTAVMEALGVAEDANPIGLIIVAIIALAAGFAYLWTHSAAFRGFWIDLWHGIQTVVGVVVHALETAFHAVVSAFETAWDAVVRAWNAARNAFTTAGTAIMNAWNAVMGFFSMIGHALATAAGAVAHAFVVAFDAIAGAATWLWNTILHPIFTVISVIVRILVAIVLTVLITPLVLGFKLLAWAANLLWIHGIKPAFEGIAFVAKWLWTSIIQPVVNLILWGWGKLTQGVMWLHDKIWNAIDAVGGFFSWLWQAKIMPVINLIVTGYNKLVTGVMWLHDKIWNAIDVIGQFFVWLWNHSIGWLIAKAAQGWNLFVIGLGIWRDRLVSVLKAVGGWFSWLWDHSGGWLINKAKQGWDLFIIGLGLWRDRIVGVLKAVGGWFSNMWNKYVGPLLSDISKGFDNTVKGIETAWNKIKSIVAVPINFMINMVYNNGIVPVWNGIIGLVGLGNLKLKKASPVKLAGGGVFPGYAPGVDSIHAMVSPGEAVLVPELVRAIGPANIMAMNAAASGRPGTVMGGPAASGGLVPHFAGGGVIGNILGLVGGIGNQIKDVVTNPVAAVEKAVGGSSDWLSMVAHMPATMIDDFAKFLWNKFTSITSVGDQVQGRVNQIASGQHMAIILAAMQAAGITSDQNAWVNGMNVLIGRESGWNPNSINLTDINAKNGDPSRGLAQTIMSTFQAYRVKSLPNNIFDPVANVAASIRYIESRYHRIENVQQANPNLPPKGYDRGGPVMPGYTTIYNGLRKQETMLPFSPNELTHILGNDGDGSDTYELVGGSLSIAGDGLNAVVSGRIKKTSASTGRRVGAGFR
jgi:TP901 family phage tail tape measure protein